MDKQKLRFLVLAVAAMPACAAADSVSGQFELGGKPIKPAAIAAFRMRDQFHPRSFETYVVLSGKPLERKDEIRNSLDPYSAAINDPDAQVRLALRLGDRPQRMSPAGCRCIRCQ